MAEYYAVLSKAIAGLTSTSPETRRAVYDKARNALIGQLRAIDPPLPTSEISRQRLELEEAIRRVEREILTGVLPPAVRPSPEQAAARAAPTPPPPAPAPQPARRAAPAEPAPDDGRRSPQDIFRQAILDAESRGSQAGAERAAITARPAIERPAARPRPPQAPPPAARREPPPPDTAADMDDMARERPALPASGRSSNERMRPAGEPRLAPEYDFDGEAEAEARPVRPPLPERSREVRLGPAPIDQEIDDVAPSRRGSKRKGDVPSPPEPVGAAREAREPREAKRRRSRAPLILLALILLLAGGIGWVAWTQPGAVRTVIALFDKPAAKPAVVASVAVPADDPASGKNGDRLLPAGQAPNPNVRVIEPSTGSVPAGGPTTLLAPPTTLVPGGVKPPATAPSAGGPVGAPGPTAALPSPGTAQTPSGPVVAQKATLYEEPTDPSLAASRTLSIAATVTWSFVNAGADGPEVIGDVVIPDRKMKLRLTIRRNRDASLPASHMVELSVETAPDFPGKGVQTVPTIVLKPTEDGRGDVLIGASATVATGFYWIALSSAQRDLASNIGLLRDRGWIDIRLVYATGQRAILTLEKGPSGETVFAKAVSAWTTG